MKSSQHQQNQHNPPQDLPHYSKECRGPTPYVLKHEYKDLYMAYKRSCQKISHLPKNARLQTCPIHGNREEELEDIRSCGLGRLHFLERCVDYPDEGHVHQVERANRIYSSCTNGQILPDYSDRIRRIRDKIRRRSRARNKSI
jgi:hypothetical protein